ncbi:hypothetical protein, partial [Streptomyces nigrescens]
RMIRARWSPARRRPGPEVRGPGRVPQVAGTAVVIIVGVLPGRGPAHDEEECTCLTTGAGQPAGRMVTGASGA